MSRISYQQTTFDFLPPKLTKLDQFRQHTLPPQYHGDCTVYLLHFHEEIGNLSNRRGKARHYVGMVVSPDPEVLKYRLLCHRRGYANSSKITRALFEQGIGFHVGHIWTGVSSDFERVIKDHHKHADYCAICQDVPFFDHMPLYLGRGAVL